MISKAEARKVMLSIKGTSEAPYFGKPSIFYAENFVARVHDKEEAVALRVGTIEMRDVMLEAEPKLFYITDHYKPWPMLLARLSALDRKTLKSLITGRIAQLAQMPPKKPRSRQKRAPKLTLR